MRSSSQWPRRSARTKRNRRIALTALGAITAGGVVRARRSRGAAYEDPCGPEGLALPEGERLTITANDGADLNVLVAGPADGPVVLLPHCWMGGMTIWGAVARRLVASGHRVVLWDQRGHGESTLGTDPITVDRLGHDLDHILRELDLSDVVLAGHSMGGMTVQAFAATNPDAFRERVRGVALVSTATRNGGYLKVPHRVATSIFGDKRTATMGKRPLSRTPGVMGRLTSPASVAATGEAMLAASGVARAGFLVAMTTMDYRSTLPTIKVPTKILVGSRDFLTPVARAKALAAGIPDAELRVLKGYSHMLPFEAPEVVAETIVSLTR